MRSILLRWLFLLSCLWKILGGPDPAAWVGGWERAVFST